MPDLTTQPAEIRFTLTIKRADTGKVEHHEMIGHVLREESTNPPEADHGSDSRDLGSQRGD